MSEANRVVAALDSGEFSRWLKESRVKEACPLCEAGDWSVLVDDHRATGLVVTEKDAIDLATFIPLIAMMCRNCGFIRSHSLVHFLKWQDRKREQGDGRNADPQ
jgi:hypothetical protein